MTGSMAIESLKVLRVAKDEKESMGKGEDKL